MEEISAKDLAARLKGGEDVQIIDVREPHEYDTARLEGSKLIPLGQIVSRMNELDESREAIVHCKMGGRSARAIEALKAAGYKGQLTNLRGGITAWSTDVDPSVPRY